LKSRHANVKAAFEANFLRGLERGAQLVVYDGDVKTVDLSGITIPEDPSSRPYDGDSISMIWSTGKNLGAIAMCILVDKGLLNYEEKVCKYWPEFAKNGKEDILVEDVLRHDAGLFAFHRSLRYDETLRSLGEVIENSTPLCKDRVYHGYSRGLILNQICIRCDPGRRTIAALLEDELFSKIGMKNHYILGNPREELQTKVHPFTNKSDLWMMANIMCPSFMRCNMPWTSTFSMEREFQRHVMRIMDSFKASLLFENPLFFNMAAEQDFATKTEIVMPSVWCLTSARLLAKCAALMSQGGIIGGVRILKQATVEEALSSPTTRRERHLNANFAFTKGGFGIISGGSFDIPEELTGNEFYGWPGANGSMLYFQYKGGKPGGLAVGYNCTGGYKQMPFDIRGPEILRQLGLSCDWHESNYALPKDMNRRRGGKQLGTDDDSFYTKTDLSEPLLK